MTTPKAGEPRTLAAALAKFQAEMPIVPKKQTARIPGKDGKQGYTYTYAGLADVSEIALPILSKHGLSFVALPTATDRGFVLTGVLLHESGERLEGSLPIAGSRPQDIGSSITYGRRYLFGCMTGLVTDDDDDGQLAQRAERSRLVHDEPAPQPPKVNPAREPWPEAVRPGDVDGGDPMQPRTRARLFALFGEHHITDPDEQRAGISHIIGRPIASRSELTEGEAQAVIKVLAARPKPAPAEVSS